MDNAASSSSRAIRAVLNFFASPYQRWKPLDRAGSRYRKSIAFEAIRWQQPPGSVRVSASPSKSDRAYNQEVFIKALTIYSLTILTAEDFVPKVRVLCCRAASRSYSS